VLTAALLATTAVSCSDDGSSATNGGADNAESVDDLLAGIDLDLATVTPGDRRPDLLAQLGAPESFVLSVGSVDGVASRFESWQYWSSQTQVDFVDGEISFNVALQPVPDGTVLPLDYAPDEFVLLATVDEVRDTLVGVELTEVVDDIPDCPSPGIQFKDLSPLW